MPTLLKVYKISLPINKPKQPKSINKKKRIEMLVSYIENKLILSEHAKIKIQQRRLWKRFNWERAKKRIALMWNSTVLDETTWNIRICYRGRRILNNYWLVITFMNAQAQTKQTVIQNHKKKHKYKPMELLDIEKFWYTS